MWPIDIYPFWAWVSSARWLLTRVTKFRLSDRAQQTSTLPLENTANENEGTIPKGHTMDDGKSVSSGLEDLNLRAKRRAAAEIVHGQDLETGGRRTKLRSGSFCDSYGRGPTSHPPQPYDTARDQRPIASATPPLPVPGPQDPSNTRSHPDSSTAANAPQRSTGLIPVDKVPLFPTDHQKTSLSFSPELGNVASTSPPPSPVFTSGDRESAILLQPETRPITQEQLVNEVKGIYAGLVMVEKKCVEVH
jgi:hypothetical protein